MTEMPIICDACNSNNNKYIFKRFDEAFGKQGVFQCKDCGLVFTSPLPDIGILKNHYSKHFFTQKFDYIESGKIWERFYELNLKYIEKIKNRTYPRTNRREGGAFVRAETRSEDAGVAEGQLRKARTTQSQAEQMTSLPTSGFGIGSKGKLLEIGCGLGHFLNVAKRRGWETYGVEFSEFASNYAMNNLNLKVYNNSLEKVGFADNQFDVVVLWATLEHMLKPLKELAEIYRITARGGLLALSVPNHGSFLTRLYGMQNTDMQHFEHIYHFPLRTLRAMLNKVGFIDLRRMIVFGGSPNRSYFQDISQYLARILNIGSELRVIAFKPS